MAQVTLNKVVKKFADLEVVHGIDLDIADQEFVVLVGPSGCGKSTTLRMIAGLEETSGGDIVIGGQVVNDLPPKDRDIAMVFQNYALYPHMTVFENMSFGLRLKKFPKAEIKQRVERAARILDITELLNRRPRQLSGGHRQRVAMGRAIVRNPKVFLFDEPLSNLDAKLRVQMRTEIKKVHQQVRTTTVYVTHDQVEAMTMADRIARYRPYAGRELTFGLRPEDIIEKRGDLPPGRAAFDAQLDVVEPMGMETMVYFLVQGTEVCGRVDPAVAGKPGETMPLVADLNHMHLIDPKTDQVL